MQWKAAILSASDRGSRGEREDTSIQVIRELIEEEIGGVVVDSRVVPDEIDEIMAALIEMTDGCRADIVITTGGIGLGERDVTPEATLRAIDRQIPGLAEAMRAYAARRSRVDMLTRGVAGIRGRTLILNLPGSPKGVHEHFSAVLDLIPEALRIIHSDRAPGG